MSRGKLRSAVEVCGDCGCHDPTWASINRGILICDECCSVHRSLGRHVSQVKCLKRDTWSPSQLAMVHTLHTNGANSIWEHSLLDPTNAKSGRRKPNPKDPLNPTKADFIRAKHQMLAFIYRPNKDDKQTVEGDISKQLHSCVRTANLETCLKLLSLGADPNFFHPEKGICPIHVAARAGQCSQVELLVVYGADPGAYDWEGITAAQHARNAGNIDLADRLIELAYELTDRLAHFVCGRKPDHLHGHHFIIPEMADSLEVSEYSKVAKRRLQTLSNCLFEELAMDVYDEVDRRHTDDIWLACQTHGTMVVDRCTVPFLPVNPEYSSTRNQGRQKLARFNNREFMTLIIDMLSEARLRLLGLAPIAVAGQKHRGNLPTRQLTVSTLSRVEGAAISDDEPLYDSVASDDESLLDQNLAAVQSARQRARLHERVNGRGSIAAGEYGMVNKQLAVAEARIQQLLASNKDMKQEISTLQTMVQRLLNENATLRSQVQSVVQSTQCLPNGHERTTPSSDSVESVFARSPRGSQRPQSMYEPREQQRHFLLEVGNGACDTRRSKDDSHPYMNCARRSSELDCGDRISIPENDILPDSFLTPAIRHDSRMLLLNHCHSQAHHETNSGLPSQGEALGKTKSITDRIQELHALAREGRHENYVTCAEKIHGAVLEMAGIFPEDAPDERVKLALKELTGSALRLHTETKILLNTRDRPVDQNYIAEQIVLRAYDTTKAIKTLITLLQ